MIRFDFPQGSVDWTEARLGIPTASQFHNIITPKTLKPSAQASKYLYRLVAEWILGVPLDQGENGYMTRGQELEDEAVRFYEFERGITTEKVGFCLRDDRAVGCSPDRFVGKDGMAEIKCPAPHTHVGYLLDGIGDDYRCQLQGQLWIAERRWLDFESYHPDMPAVLLRIERDETFIAALHGAVDDFCVRLDAAKERMIALGVVPQTREAA